MLWYDAYDDVIINYVCSAFSHQLCFHHSSDFSMQEGNSIQLNMHQSTVHRKVYIVAVGVCIVLLQEQLNQFRLLSYCYEHMWCWSSSLGDFSSSMCGNFLESWSQFACLFASLLSIRGELPPTVACIFLLLLPLVPHVWWFKKTELSCYFNGLNLPGMFPFLLEHLHLH